MIYPQKLNSKKGSIILYTLIFVSIVLASLLILINKLTTPEIHWSAIANCGIIYIWITVMYSIKRNTNIAGHVLLQTIAISAVIVYIDERIGFRGWSISIGIPIVLMIANIAMLILTIISYKKYVKYAICQLMIVLISLIPMFLIGKKIVDATILMKIAILISVFSLTFSLFLCYRDIKEAVVRKIHM